MKHWKINSHGIQELWRTLTLLQNVLSHEFVFITTFKSTERWTYHLRLLLEEGNNDAMQNRLCVTEMISRIELYFEIPGVYPENTLPKKTTCYLIDVEIIFKKTIR